jgi:Dolichyl-phosphate-mannose-protein mannosyltransferase
MRHTTGLRALISAQLLRRISNQPALLVFGIIVVGTAARLITAAAVGSTYDEAYYVAAARHFSLSYFDHPPLLMWIIGLTMQVTGSDDIFILRSVFVIVFAATTWVAFQLTKELYGARAGATAALLLNLSPVFTLGAGALLVTEGPLTLCLLLCAVYVNRIANGPVSRSNLLTWASVGFWFGLAMLTKYTAALNAVGLALFALTSTKHRRWFAESGPYVACVISLVIFSPVLFWNFQHEWASFSFHGERVSDGNGIDLGSLFVTVLGHAAWIGPWISIPMLFAFAQALARGPRDSKTWLMCCLAIVPIVLFTAVSLWTRQAASHPHWPAPGYLMLFPVLGAAVAGMHIREPLRVRRWLTASAVFTILIPCVLVTEALTGWVQRFKASALSEHASTHDASLQLFDWNELKPTLAKHGFIDRTNLFVVGTHRYEVAKLDTQLGGNLPIVCLCADPRNIAYEWNQNHFLGWDALIIGLSLSPAAARDSYGSYFDEIEPVDSVEVRRGGLVLLHIDVYYAKNYRRLYPLPTARKASQLVSWPLQANKSEGKADNTAQPHN